MNINKNVRGGSWDDHQLHARAASRCGDRPGNRDDYMGFRVVCDVEPESEVYCERDKPQRGGSWNHTFRYARNAERLWDYSDYTSDFLGFRVVCEPSN